MPFLGGHFWRAYQHEFHYVPTKRDQAPREISAQQAGIPESYSFTGWMGLDERAAFHWCRQPGRSSEVAGGRGPIQREKPPHLVLRICPGIIQLGRANISEYAGSTRHIL